MYFYSVTVAFTNDSIYVLKWILGRSGSLYVCCLSFPTYYYLLPQTGRRFKKQDATLRWRGGWSGSVYREPLQLCKVFHWCAWDNRTKYRIIVWTRWVTVASIVPVFLFFYVPCLSLEGKERICLCRLLWSLDKLLTLGTFFHRYSASNYYRRSVVAFLRRSRSTPYVIHHDSNATHHHHDRQISTVSNFLFSLFMPTGIVTMLDSYHPRLYCLRFRTRLVL